MKERPQIIGARESNDCDNSRADSKPSVLAPYHFAFHRHICRVKSIPKENRSLQITACGSGRVRSVCIPPTAVFTRRGFRTKSRLCEGYISVFKQNDADHCQPLAEVPSALGARTAGYFGKIGKKGFDRLYVAVPARAKRGAEVWIYTSKSDRTTVRQIVQRAFAQIPCPGMPGFLARRPPVGFPSPTCASQRPLKIIDLGRAMNQFTAEWDAQSV
jgi:hypothetical protein